MNISTVSRLEIEQPARWNNLKETTLRIVDDEGHEMASISLRELAEALAPYLTLGPKPKDGE